MERKKLELLPSSKKGGTINTLVFGIGSLIIGIIVIYVIVSTILDANLITGTQNASAQALSANLTTGVNNVAAKVPILFTVAVIVLLLGVFVLLLLQYRNMKLDQGGSSL